jgi:hypothetical protein
MKLLAGPFIAAFLVTSEVVKQLAAAVSAKPGFD